MYVLFLYNNKLESLILYIKINGTNCNLFTAVCTNTTQIRNGFVHFGRGGNGNYSISALAEQIFC